VIPDPILNSIVPISALFRVQVTGNKPNSVQNEQNRKYISPFSANSILLSFFVKILLSRFAHFRLCLAKNGIFISWRKHTHGGVQETPFFGFPYTKESGDPRREPCFDPNFAILRAKKC
jgi:hypothetical protein